MAASHLRRRLHAAVRDAAPDGDAHGDPAPPRLRHAPHGRARRRCQRGGGDGPMNPHLLYVVAAYGISALVLAALAWWILA
ncbi:MAG: heme exporter protein CcmD, partial [Bauldia sp.]